MIDLVQTDGPFVAFVGAGASAIPPARLPTWNEFNTLLLECLCERLAEYSRNRQPTDQMLTAFRARRDATRFFAPDFQAQLMEEEVGQDYFRVWQSLETDAYGLVHAGLAELAARGRLAAIVTTNFDRLIETALRARNQAFVVAHDRAGFEGLEMAGGPGRPLPVLKIHGSIEDPASRVDTLRQRLVGRPESLTKALRMLLHANPWLYLGFSGADFDYDPHYLGILDAAADARGFVFLAREGTPVRDGVRRLADAYGPQKASIVHGDLATWLSETFGLAPACPPTAPADDAARRVQEGVQRWVNGLGPMSVVNILYSMLKSSGMEEDALWLLRKTWRSYRSPGDIKGRSYARYNFNYGLSLLDRGFISNPVALEEGMGNLAEWKEHADQNAYEFFARSDTSGELPAAGAQLAAVLAYRGEVGRAIALASKATDEALGRNARLELCDIAAASTVVYDIVRLFEPAAAQLRGCVAIAKELGDEPRRAMLSAQLGRFLTYAGHFDDADRALAEAEQIARRLDLRAVLLAVQAARGRWLTDGGKSDEAAVRTLREVAEAIRAQDDVPLFTRVDVLQPDSPPAVVKGRNPTLCRVLLDLNRAARFAGNADVMTQTLDELDELATEVFPGYCPHYYLAYVECLLQHGGPDQRELMADLIRRARQVGEQSQNPWVAGAADRIESQLRSQPAV